MSTLILNQQQPSHEFHVSESKSATVKGAQVDRTRGFVIFAVFSQNATRMEAWIYGQPTGAHELERVQLQRNSDGWWTGEIAIARFQDRTPRDVLYYGYRAWGPNWIFDPSWEKGGGFICDVDDAGNRFNPNKLLLDPYAQEISHCPAPRLSSIDPNEYVADYDSGMDGAIPLRFIDTGLIAPKSMLLLEEASAAPLSASAEKPLRPLSDDIVYEVHVRGFTKLDLSIPEEYRGTYRGAALKARYLAELGVTAVEFLPVFHFADEQNDDGDPRGDNYWGYMTLGFFAPNRRYAFDKSPGGPTAEFRAMVSAFHEAGIKVLLDVVFNHTGEGILKRQNEGDSSRSDDALQDPNRACLLSFRGLDNASYYTLRSRPDLDNGGRNRRYQDNSACGPSLNVSNRPVCDFILDSLRYWSSDMGVDGFRFDLGPVLGNCVSEGGFRFDWSAPDSLLQRMGCELPLRDDLTNAGVDLIAEPWALGEGTYQLGHFPDRWAEWNDTYRIVLRRAENALSVCTVAPYEIANAVAGSDQQFRQGTKRLAPRPSNSINYIASHDGYTLRDVNSFNGGDWSWDHLGDPARQQKAVRNALVLLMTSAGVPMICGGDELYRTISGRKNVVAIDDESVFLHWDYNAEYRAALASGDADRLAELRKKDEVRVFELARTLMQLRNRCHSLRPPVYFTGCNRPGSVLKDISWYGSNGSELPAGLGNPQSRFLGYRIDAGCDTVTAGIRSIYVAYNWDQNDLEIVLPRNVEGFRWHRIVDTAEWLAPSCNVDPNEAIIQNCYGLHERSAALFLEK